MKKAVAIGYDKERDRAPKVIARGRGEIAEKIIEKAEEYGIYIKEDKALVELLDKFDLYQEIPPEMYDVIAEIILYVYNLEKKV